jgi:hypothetical protein
LASKPLEQVSRHGDAPFAEVLGITALDQHLRAACSPVPVRSHFRPPAVVRETWQPFDTK